MGAFPVATPTTFLLFLLLAPVSASSFCVGSTDTFLGLPRVTRDDAIAMPGAERKHYDMIKDKSFRVYVKTLRDMSPNVQFKCLNFHLQNKLE